MLFLRTVEWAKFIQNLHKVLLGERKFLKCLNRQKKPKKQKQKTKTKKTLNNLYCTSVQVKLRFSVLIKQNSLYLIFWTKHKHSKYHDLLRKMILIYKKQPSFPYICTKSFALIRESYALILKSYALICKSYAIIRESFALFRKS